MKNYIIKRKQSGEVLLTAVPLAKSFYSRFRGLMGHTEKSFPMGLMIDRCNSIHTCFMRFPLDVYFLDQNNKVVRVVHQLKPWRLSPVVWSACRVLELPAGKIPHLKQGEELEIICTN